MDRFVARQPIFDSGRQVYAYELLFRTGWENAFPAGFSSDRASLTTLESILHAFGLQELCGTKRAFINATRQVLVTGLFHLLPPEQAVCEVLETVEPDAEVVAACRALAEKGFIIALDDFVLRPGWEPLLELADVVKVDFRATPPADRIQLAADLRPYEVKLLAEKVETEAEFAEAVDAGYAYLQGYFFARPEVRVAQELPAGQAMRLHLLREAAMPELDLEAIEAILKRDVALAVNLLRFLNSAAFGWRSRVTTLRQALVLLGEVSFRRWVQVAAVGGLATRADLELLQTCLCRARLGEQVAAQVGLSTRSLDLFWCGLLSGLERLTGRPLPMLLASLGVPDDLRRALVGDPASGPIGQVISLVKAYEMAAWDEVERLRLALKLPVDAMPDLFAEAANWARAALGATGVGED